MINMDEEIKLTDIERDALKEIANIGAGNASASLSEMVNKKVNIVVSDMDFVSLENVQEVIGAPQELVVGVYTTVTGDMSGTILIIYPISSALALASVLLKKESEPSKTLSDSDKGALIKMGNILCDSYLGSLGEFLEMNLTREDSKIVSTFGESVVDLVMLSIDPESKQGLLIKTGFDIQESNISGEFVLLLSSKKIDAVLKKVKSKISM